MVDADIKNYFCMIDQQKLMYLLKKRISDRRMLKLVRKFLKAGVLENGEIQSTLIGAPQGGVLSPLLANIYLNYLDKIWEKKCRKLGVLVRYADNLVVLCGNEENAQEALRRLNIVMKRLGLVLHPGKTRVVNLRDGKEGFDFLGFHNRKVRSWKRRRYYLQHWPGKKAMSSIRDKIKIIIGERRQRLYRGLKQVIEKLNPVLKGWGNYFAKGNSSKQFCKIDSYVIEKLCLFLSKKHMKAGRRWGERWKDIDFRALGLYRLTGTVQWHQYSVNVA